MSGKRPSKPAENVRLTGFGVDRAANGYHFVVKHHVDESVTILERYPDAAMESGEMNISTEVVKAQLNAYRWARIVEPVTQEFNTRLLAEGVPAGRWLKQETPLAPYFGKELALLFWAIEEADATIIPMMVANWRGLAPEERWWFYTTINATTTGPDRGWRKAIKFAFADNPVDLPPSALLVGPQEISSGPNRSKPKRSSKSAKDNAQGTLRLFDDT